MRAYVLVLALAAAVAAGPRHEQKIVGGSLTTINQYPDMAALLFTSNLSTFWQRCGGVILNARSILTAAHCPSGWAPHRWRVRVGSTFANSGGRVVNVVSFLIHPTYNVIARYDCDIAIMRLVSNLAFSTTVRQASLGNYVPADNVAVTAIGWGATSFQGPASEQLRHVQIRTINQNTCANRYRVIGRTVTANMLCSGVLDVGGRDQCQGDSGGPLYHNRVVVGICSWGEQCALARFPGVNARVSRFITWIRNNS